MYRFEPGKLHGISMNSLKKMKSFITEIIKKNLISKPPTGCARETLTSENRKRQKTAALNPGLGLDDDSDDDWEDEEPEPAETKAPASATKAPSDKEDV